MKTPSVRQLYSYYKCGEHNLLVRWLPHFQDSKDRLIRFLFNSNLLTIGDKLELPPLTFGADPEFILIDKKTKEIVLFSSEYTDEMFGLSEAEIGADYGLLEFRLPPTESPKKLINQLKKFHRDFTKSYKNIKILEKEAVVFNHKLQRLREFMDKKKDIQYGGNRGKDVNVWTGNNDIIIDNENQTTFSAYSKPKFQVYREDVLTAGGHIHIGGTFVKMLSFEQLQKLVQEFDKQILPICESVETDASKLRKEIYGQNGEFRIKDYGIEYRSPSNAIFLRKNSKVLLKVYQKIESITKNIALL